MVGLNGKVTNGAGHPAHKAGLMQAEPYAPCITRPMTPEERAFYGVDSKKGESKGMAKRQGKRISLSRLKELIDLGYTVAEIAEELDTDEAVIWQRAKNYGFLRKLKGNDEPDPEEEEEIVGPDPEEEEEEEEIAEPDPEDEETEANEPEYPQDSEENEYRFISPEWLDAIARGLTKGAVKHPGETWRTIPAREHLFRAMRHINLYLMGDRTDDHICNASMRVMMAFETAIVEDQREEWEKLMREAGC